MEIFSTLLIKLIPLYFLILLGYLVGKYLHIRKKLISFLLIGFIAPVVVFTGILTTKITMSTLSIPFLFFATCVIITLLILPLAGFIWKDDTKNTVAFTSASVNSGYFGLPVAVALYGQSAIGIVALVLFGTALYTNSIGYFIAAKGKYTTKESIIKVFKLPILYAILLGIIVNLSNFHLGKIYFEAANNFTGAFTILGMMLIGISLADTKRFRVDYKFLGVTLFSKFLLWPIVMVVLLFIDSQTVKLYNHSLYNLLLLMAALPLAVNIVPYTALLKVQPEKVALAVLVSTIFALFYIPFIAGFFLK